jgi:PelA/Pel-15E family pectate lyase
MFIMKMQISQDGKKTEWYAQHDPLTLAPTAARAMEPAALSGLETARLVKFLMTISEPSDELVETIRSGLAWLEQVKMTQLAKQDGKTVYISDPNSTETYWARFYDLESSEPVFPGRDGKLYKSYEAMVAVNDLGHDFLSTIPDSIVTNGQKKWQKMLSKR